MVELFRYVPKYYYFLTTLEKESTYFHKLDQEFMRKTLDNERVFAAAIETTKMRMRGVGTRRIRMVDPNTVKMLAERHEEVMRARRVSEMQVPEVEEVNAPVESRAWPVRANNSKRLLAPDRLAALAAYSDVIRLPADAALIHSTGVPHSLIGFTPTPLSSQPSTLPQLPRLVRDE
jgi:hypothetical protein